MTHATHPDPRLPPIGLPPIGIPPTLKPIRTKPPGCDGSKPCDSAHTMTLTTLAALTSLRAYIAAKTRPPAR